MRVFLYIKVGKTYTKPRQKVKTEIPQTRNKKGQVKAEKLKISKI